MKNDHCIWLNFQNFSDKTVLAFRQPHMGTVISLRFKTVRKSGEDYNFVSFFCCLNCFSGKIFIIEIFISRETFCVSNLCVSRNRLQCISYFEAVDMRTSAALETRLLGKTTDKSNLFRSFQRKDLVCIFQKDHRFFCDAACFFMVFFYSKILWCAVVCIFEDNVQDTFYSLIQNFFFQNAVFYSFHDQSIICSIGTWHFQFQPGFQTFHTVIDGTPVRHYITFKSPVITENVCEKPFVFRSKSAVDLIVRAHKCIWLSFLYRSFKCREIDLAESSFICFRGIAHAVIFLIISCEMLDGSSNMLGLYAIDKCSCDFTCKIWVF